jgi:L-ascorbate metabolism protein UlaG (beta-lactamase superfamily)
VNAALTYVGHSTLLLELAGTRLLTDPVLGRGIGHIRRTAPAPRVDDLAVLDAVLVSHAHHDHLDPPSLRQVARECPVIAPRGCGTLLRRSGIPDVVEVDAGDRVPIGGLCVEAVPAVHDGRRYPIGRRLAALGFLVEGQVPVYFAGDTDLFPEMAALAGRVDVAALPVWGWGPRLPPGHLDPEGAARAASLVRPRIAVPIHWGTLTALGAQRDMDPLDPPRSFASAVARLAPGVDARIVMPGERTVLPAGRVSSRSRS